MTIAIFVISRMVETSAGDLLSVHLDGQDISSLVSTVGHCGPSNDPHGFAAIVYKDGVHVNFNHVAISESFTETTRTITITRPDFNDRQDCNGRD